MKHLSVHIQLWSLFTMAIIPLFFISCNHSPRFSVKGTVEQATDSMLFLEANTLEGIQVLDSVCIGKSGTFHFTAPAPQLCPEFYSLRMGHKRIPFTIESTETLTFHFSYPTMTTDYEVKGSVNARKIREIHLQQQLLQQRIIHFEGNYNMPRDHAIDSINSLLRTYKENMKQHYIFKEPGQAYAYYAVCQSITDLTANYQLFNPLTNRDDVKCYATVATAWDGKWHDAPRTIQLCNMAAKGMAETAPPKQHEIKIDESKISETGIINIELPDINGHFHTLHSLKGQVVLLDFTVYGARESAQRTRLMRQLYDRYHDRGFEIYQISLDEDIHFWKYSVEKIPWICVHETNGTATNTYAVRQLPTFFLINRQNEIVRRNDVVADLEAEIKALL